MSSGNTDPTGSGRPSSYHDAQRKIRYVGVLSDATKIAIGAGSDLVVAKEGDITSKPISCVMVAEVVKINTDKTPYA
ncbi:hypothetical protein CIB48_g5195 [Xylaria polymorpha]|nr:hypothetical protein CIB48_g5195 [Xylaria polymorpha]